MRIFFGRTHRYRFGKVKIKSRYPLTEDQITSIINIVNKVMDYGYYEPCREIAKEIYEDLHTRIKVVEVHMTLRSLNVKIS